MAPLVFVADIKTVSQEARDQAIQHLYKVTDYAYANESGTSRYLVCIPIDDSDNTSIYMVEGYKATKDQEAHRAAPPVAELFKALGGGLVSAPPAAYTLSPVAGFQRSGLTTPPAGAVIILTTFGYHAGYTGFAVEGWKALVAHAQANEPGALAVSILEDAEGSKIHSVQVFDSEQSADAHVNGEAIKANRDHNGSARNGERSVVRVKALYGYLAK
ncbi:hypothetical protein BT63DRAFT_410330 [Microthyrium microscopicum]|uniref:ABM domain-containing protein n=1 Tax=Microthyrium microscopicum TaxID=703497 RepID=A0A6A6UM36_9PEZI|nr:hypothetical protein BT63DRAFT_410330 [Microthyrium microscopicum]